MNQFSNDSESIAALQAELTRTRDQLNETVNRLEEAKDTLEAIRSGEIDALVVKQADGHQVFTLKSADHTYRVFIEELTEGVVTLSADGEILYCNSSFAGLVNEPHEKLLGQPFCKFIAADHLQACNVLLQEAWEDSSRGEVHLATRSGKETPVLLSCKRLDLEDNVSLSVILADLSIQKEQQKELIRKNELLREAETTARHLNANLEHLVKERTVELEQSIQEKISIGEQLRANQDRLTKILETMAEGVIIMNVKGDITYANRMAQQMLGLKENEPTGGGYNAATGWQLLSIDGAALQQAEHPVYIAMHSTRPVYDYEVALEPPGGNKVYISFNAVPVWDETAAVTGAIGTFMDVTRRRISIQQKEDFIGVASHELKTPITTLKAALQLLDRFKTNLGHDMVPKLIDQANKGMKKLSYLVEDLLDLSRMKEGQLTLHKELFPVQQLLDNSIEHLNINDYYKISITGDTGVQVFGDGGRLEQVVVNFINNAVKYAPESRLIGITVVKLLSEVRITVSDEGPGIAHEKQDHLFDRYFRTDYAGAQSGLGLGLYISAEIIKKHGGKIGVESSPGKGSSFWFSLPL